MKPPLECSENLKVFFSRRGLLSFRAENRYNTFLEFLGVFCWSLTCAVIRLDKQVTENRC